MPTFSLHTVIQAAPEQLSSRLSEEETVILQLDSGEYFGLDEVGALLWDRLQQPTTPADLLRAVCDTYAVDEAQAQTDLFAFLETLREAGLLQSPTPAPA